MDETTRSALAELNRAFYASFAGDFARTRRGWPLGFERILPHLRSAANVLDIGCGNGRLLAFLAERGWRGRYLGIDGSAGLLASAEANRDRTQAMASFRHADLLSPQWAAALAGFAPDAVACLAVLHHVPGAAYRARLVAECAALLQPNGVLIISVWQFLSTPRLRARILPWSTVGIKDENVDPEDYLLAWGEGKSGHRYCAAIDEETLCALSMKAGLERIETFYADGHEGNLSLYAVFRASAT